MSGKEAAAELVLLFQVHDPSPRVWPWGQDSSSSAYRQVKLLSAGVGRATGREGKPGRLSAHTVEETTRRRSSRRSLRPGHRLDADSAGTTVASRAETWPRTGERRGSGRARVPRGPAHPSLLLLGRAGGDSCKVTPHPTLRRRPLLEVGSPSFETLGGISGPEDRFLLPFPPRLVTEPGRTGSGCAPITLALGAGRRAALAPLRR